MLIVPLHRPLTRETFPLATAALILLNLCVFLLLQSGDHAARIRAVEYYSGSGLAEKELPAYLAHLPAAEVDTVSAELESLPPPLRDALLAERISYDTRFAAVLEETPEFDAEWRRQRGEYDALRGRIFTERHVQRHSEVNPLRSLTAAFLHGGVAHLLGNMVFLAVLGLLVEPVLGGWRFLGVYLLGALGAGAASLVWNWGEVGGMLGASGAIAALMGACSVLWAGRRVRVFYWVFVLFDYVRVPALWLLPAWMGWELLQLAIDDSSGVAFEAHAGGLASGALLAFGLRSAGWWRPEQLDDGGETESDAQLLQRAQEMLGRMATEQAEPLLRGLLERQPGSLPVRLALFRSARLRGDGAQAARRGAAVLEAHATNAGERRLQQAVLEEMRAQGLPVAEEPCLRLVRALLASSDVIAAHSLLQAMPQIERAATAETALAQAWLTVGIELHDRDAATAHAAWRVVCERFGSTPQAEKARFLLAAHPPSVVGS